MSEPTAELAQFRSIKRVKAGEITEVLRFGCYVRNADGSVLMRSYPPNMTARYTPVVGDYWVIYDDDGYQSISPKAAFEAGYVATVATVKSDGVMQSRSYAGIVNDYRPRRPQADVAEAEFLSIGPQDSTVAILNLDGSVWCDWPRLLDMADAPVTGAKPEDIFAVIFAQGLWASRGHLPEVSRERSEEIALEYGAKLLG